GELTGLAVTVEIAGHDAFDALRRDSKSLKCPLFAAGLGAHHIIALEKRHLIEGEKRFRQKPEDGGLQLGQAPGHIDQQALAADRIEREFHELAEAQDFGSAQLIG
ncbi:MAG: hypothetical protein ACK559_08930, partial [bacterium]